MEYIISPKEMFIAVNGDKIPSMDKAHLFIVKVKGTRGNLRMDKNMEKECIIILMDHNMMVSGRMI